MSRNANSRFALVPNMTIGRSKFSRHSKVTTTLNIGDVVPFYVDDILPGDSCEIKTNKVIRLQTPVTPFMDNIYADTYYFYVPYRLVWEHWKEFMGENSTGPWTPQVEYTVPQVTAPEAGWSVGTLADYMGIPTGVGDLSVSALYFRAYALIINEWFRAQQVDDPVNVPVGDAVTVGSNGDNWITDLVKGGKPFVARKFSDYFTGALPAPQRGPAVEIPLTTEGNFPVRALADQVASVQNEDALRWSYAVSGGTVTGFGPNGSYFGLAPSGSAMKETSGSVSSDALNIVPRNLWAINDGDLIGASINSLRMAFQIQKLYERDARGGGRYIEQIKSHFGVTSPDARLQRPE